ncbi:MAG TPA: ATP-binding protein [Terriglobia bacterium]|nr:ATP-binding protein [Terriglobia bacterium]
MSVSRRVVLSVGLLMCVALGALGYQLHIVFRMQRINDELSNVNFVAAAELLQLTQAAEEVDSMSRKYMAVSDLGNRARFDEALNDRIKLFETHAGKLEAALRPWQAPAEVALLSSAWADYERQMDHARSLPVEGGVDDLPLELDLAITQLKLRVRFSYDAVIKSIEEQVGRNQAMGSQAETVSLFAGALFVVAGIIVTAITLRSVNRPLRQLIRGTRTIASGEFSHRLPVDGPTEFAGLARDFNAMTERLGELDQMKKDFVAHVSHELNAPLAAIRQTLAVVLAEAPGPINEQQRRLIELSRKSAERLGAIVANLLDVSRLEAGTMEFEMSRQDIVSLARDVADELSIRAQERKIEIVLTSAEPVMPVVCDRDRLVQVVGNLLDNALKFSPPHSKIHVTLSRETIGNGALVMLSVADRGPGVPEKHKQDIFLKFHQAHGGGKRASGQGVGLGLAIARTIVDAHSGRIWVEDNPGGGSIFRVELAAVSEEERAAKWA